MYLAVYEILLYPVQVFFNINLSMYKILRLKIQSKKYKHIKIKLV
jgi:hypothetical protein